MFNTIKEILSANWRWRGQICNLAGFEIVKKSRGAVLSWAWLIIKPSVYIFCFWFAIEVGLRAGTATADGAPYLLWLCAGIIPWNYMSDMLGAGVDVYRRYPYLVNKIKFPLCGISTIFSTASMLIQLGLLVCLFLIYIAYGLPLTIYMIQLPLILFLMWAFWTFFSILFSPLSALSKDVANLIHALSTPLFWLSGVIFNIQNVDIGWVQVLFNLNPVTFFVSGYRHVFCDHMWIWEDPAMLGGFILVFAIVIILACITYKSLNQEVCDVL